MEEGAGGLDPRPRAGDARGRESGPLGGLVELLADRAADEAASAPAPDGTDPAGSPGPAGPPPADAATLAAAEQIRARMEAGAAPAGLRRLAEALAGAETAAGTAPSMVPPSMVPRQRTAAESPAPLTDVVAAVRTESLLVLEGHRPVEIAAAVDDLARAGMRVAVTAADLARLDAVTPTVDRLPALTGPEQRELRLLLATATPARRDHSRRQLPPPPAFPPADEIRALCAHADGSGRARAGGPDLLRDVLTALAEPRLAAVTEVARAVRAALDALDAGEDSWARPLLADLVHSRHRPVFDTVRAAAAEALGIADRSRDLPLVTLAGGLPAHAHELLVDYREFLDSGGRARRRFRNGVQREVQPVLDLIRVGGEVPADARSVHAAVLHVELAGRLTAVDEGCRTLGIPTPDDVGDLRALVAGLGRVDEAARAVGQLRHDVLFLHPSSPIAVPDLAAAEQVAAGILDVAEHGSAPEAAARLDAIADGLAGSGAAAELSAGHRAAVEALRARDAEAYEAALAALEPTRREVADQARCDALLARLRAEDPEAARAFADGRGFVWSVPLESLLSRLPADDVLDAIVVLDAAELSVERLLVAAAAPRLLAVAGPDAHPADGGATVLGALQRAEAPVVAPPRPPDPGGRVMRLPTARRPEAPRREQAGA
ncbi:hypothetical protein LWC35_20900 [Pseudonocardia kujensis]|uniref:hypothetical protein n=1 Tax=Pseudonocardia kujensis TaxID=1128675 RepID=UPI001E654445|nr:hypothetical protein [Pseudonocardia kujensis]MCE0765341.1 hypothetical protein [Pseudonocardia kujensis]